MMAFKFNRGCWVESEDDLLLYQGKGAAKPGRSPLRDIPETQTLEMTGAKRPLRPSLMQKIDLAGRLFEAWSTALHEANQVRALLHQLEEDLHESHEAMIQFGVSDACARCDAVNPHGSCCSRGLEEKYDAMLLLINLLMGANLPDTRERSDSCFFLGGNGCKLRVRNMLCVDYLCPEVEKAMGHEKLVAMQTIAGREIETAFRLHEAVKRTILHSQKT